MNEQFTLPATKLIEMAKDARQRTFDLISDLSDDQLMGPQLDVVNPLLWEIGHVSFFHEVFVLRQLEEMKPILDVPEETFNSFEVEHDDRWQLLLPTRAEMLGYMQTVLDRMIARFGSSKATAQETYLYLLGIFHEDMHDEAFTYTRQTLAWSEPKYGNGSSGEKPTGGPLPGDVEIPGGTYGFGAEPGHGFVFDNEKWAHPIEVAPFKIARAATTNGEFAEFVEAGGYQRPELWSYGGQTWLKKSGTNGHLYLKLDGQNWMRRHFDTWVPMEEHQAVIHVNWYEAEAYCNWKGRRLPTEPEWELAASAEPTEDGRGIRQGKRLYPWGDEPPTPERANLDARFAGCVDVGAFPEGDSAFGCRQIIGNVWEWTASPFYPFPGYIVDQPYKEYSAPWFGYNKVLRGGCWATRSRLIRNTYRNFYLPHRRDVFAGFRTCEK